MKNNQSTSKLTINSYLGPESIVNHLINDHFKLFPITPVSYDC